MDGLHAHHDRSGPGGARVGPPAAAARADSAMSDATAGTQITRANGSSRVDEIKRTTGPQSTNGGWEVQLSDSPTAVWLTLFKASEESSDKVLPKRVEFDRAAAIFKSEEDQVEHWIESLDKWIASTN